MKSNKGFLTRIIGSACVLMAVLSSCATIKLDKIDKVYDASLPDSQQSVIVFPGGEYRIRTFDGQEVTGWSSLTSYFKYTVVKIPSGQHTIGFDYWAGAASLYRSQKGISGIIDVLPMKNYLFFPRVIEGKWVVKTVELDENGKSVTGF